MVINQIVVAFNNGERTFTVPRDAAMLKISLASGSVEVYGKMTKDETFVKLSGVKQDLSVKTVAEAGITSFEVAGFHSVRLVNVDAPDDGVVSTLIG